MARRFGPRKLQVMKMLVYFLLGNFLFFSCSNGNLNSAEATEVSSLDNTKINAPENMVHIPGGTFLMGGKSIQADKDELPRHEVTVDGFFMDETEVTNEQFSEFVRETGYITMSERKIDWEMLKKQVPPNTPKPADSLLAPGSLVFTPTSGPVNLNDYSLWWTWTIGANWKHPQGPESTIIDRMDHPVVHVCYDDALAYAKWAGKRLPTEAEWEWASMGGKSDPKYPWGDLPASEATDKANFWQGVFPFHNTLEDGAYLTSAVKTYAPNGYGLYDMAGNVWEWCQDKYHFEGYSPENRKTDVNPLGPEFSYDPLERFVEKFVVRGGSFLCNDSYCSGYRVARRMRSSRDTGLSHTGFRCVKDLK